MSRALGTQQWLIRLFGCLCMALSNFQTASGLVASGAVVPSSCGRDFFLPPVHRWNSLQVVCCLEVMACHDTQSDNVTVNITFATVAGDLMHTSSLNSSQTVWVRVEDLAVHDLTLLKSGVKLASTHEISVTGHMTMAADVITLLPLTALSTSYLVPNLRRSDFEEQRVIVYSVLPNTSVTLKSHAYSRFFNNAQDESDGDSGLASDINVTYNGNSPVSNNYSYANYYRDGSSYPGSTDGNTSTHPTSADTFVRHSFASDWMTQFLNVDNDVIVLVQSDKPVGVVVLVTLPSSWQTSAGPADEVTISGASDQTLGVTGLLEDDQVVAVEMALPLSSFGTVFYLPLVQTMRSLQLLVSGEHNASLQVRCTQGDVTEYMNHSLRANTSLLIEQPVKGLQSTGYLWLSSTSQVQVYVVTDICVAGQGDTCSVNTFFLPAVEQFFHCTVDTNVDVCHVACPSFWNTAPCFQTEWSPTASERTVSHLSPFNSRQWEVYETVKEMSVNVTDICLVTDVSYMQFRLDMNSTTFLPAGSRTVPLYSACARTSVGNGGDGDGVDNDCDGTVDEESVNLLDDDQDGAVDEDTAASCLSDVITTIRKRAQLRRMVTSLGDNLFDYEEENSEMPFLAVITSLSVAFFAVVGVISIFLLLELMSRRRQLRNTKIRPFVS